MTRTHTEALEGSFMPEMYVDTQKTFTPSEFLLHQQVLNAGVDQYIPVYTSTCQHLEGCAIWHGTTKCLNYA
jgi:hypothetical protein